MTALISLNNVKDLDTGQYQRALALRVAEAVGCRDALDLVQVARFVMDGRDPWSITDHMEGRSTGPHLHFESPAGVWWDGAQEVTDEDNDTWVRNTDGRYQQRLNTGAWGLILTPEEINRDYGPITVVKGPKADTNA